MIMSSKVNRCSCSYRIFFFNFRCRLLLWCFDFLPFCSTFDGKMQCIFCGRHSSSNYNLCNSQQQSNPYPAFVRNTRRKCWWRWWKRKNVLQTQNYIKYYGVVCNFMILFIVIQFSLSVGWIFPYKMFLHFCRNLSALHFLRLFLWIRCDFFCFMWPENFFSSRFCCARFWFYLHLTHKHKML